MSARFRPVLGAPAALEDRAVATTRVGRATSRGRAAIRRADARHARWMLLGGLLLVRIVLSTVMISRPGLQYDETLFVNAATLRVPGIFLLQSFHGIPLLLMSYIGALKSWLYDPIFALFGTSPATIRTPVVLLASAGMVLTYLAIRDLVNRPVAIVAFAALCFDNSVLWFTRDDVGPSAIEFFLKCAALLCAARFARRPSARWVSLLLATMALGVFNKLNFIWTVNAATAISLVVIVRYRGSLRHRWRLAALWFVGLAVLYACFAVYYLHNDIASTGAGLDHGGLGQPWLLFKNGTFGVLSGTWFYDYALAPADYNSIVVWVFITLFSAGAIASVIFRRLRNLAVAGLALATLLVALQTKLTPQATAGWHYVSIYPFVTIVASYGAYAIARTVVRRQRSIYVTLACALGVALAYDGAVLAGYLNVLASKEPTNAGWSPAIYRLSRELQGSHASIFTADWGILNPLFALHPSRRYTELTFQLAAPTSASLAQVGSMLAATPGPKLIVTHPVAVAAFPQVDASLVKAAGRHLRLVNTVDGHNGRPVFLVYAYR
jgi:4-amino-4-deoxy-L-arabinose transferase-like glycosyltransferase